jgi:hypothetical protein
MNSNLNKLTKSQLLNIISHMKKVDLINIIEVKSGGDGNIIKETNLAIRKSLKINISKLNNKSNNKSNNNLIMSNNKLYENI